MQVKTKLRMGLQLKKKRLTRIMLLALLAMTTACGAAGPSTGSGTASATRDETASVTRDETASVTRDETASVTRDEATAVIPGAGGESSGDESLPLEGKVPAQQADEVSPQPIAIIEPIPEEDAASVPERVEGPDEPATLPARLPVEGEEDSPESDRESDRGSGTLSGSSSDDTMEAAKPDSVPDPLSAPGDSRTVTSPAPGSALTGGTTAASATPGEAAAATPGKASAATPGAAPVIPSVREGSSPRLIVIDPGHAASAYTGTEPAGPGSKEQKMKSTGGTSGVASGLKEHELNLIIALQLKTELTARGYDVVLTRETADVQISNAERAQVANNLQADVFLRIHANGAENASVNGAMTICTTSKSPYVPQMYAENRRLSDCVLDAYCAATGAKKERVWETDSMTGNNWSNVPTTMIEMGYMTNREEDLKMADPAYQQLMVQGIADGIDAYFS